jgi:hypothetical protein
MICNTPTKPHLLRNLTQKRCQAMRAEQRGRHQCAMAAIEGQPFCHIHLERVAK